MNLFNLVFSKANLSALPTDGLSNADLCLDEERNTELLNQEPISQMSSSI
jgi:hypothetical protein